MASKSGRKRRQLEDRLALTRGGNTTLPAKPPTPPMPGVPAATRKPALAEVVVSSDKPAVDKAVTGATPEQRAPVVELRTLRTPTVPTHPSPVETAPLAARGSSAGSTPWRGSGVVDISLGAPRVLDGAALPVAGSPSVWPERISPSASANEPVAAGPACGPASVVAPPSFHSAVGPVPPPCADDSAFLLARIESRLEALSQWAREFSAWQARKDAVPPAASAAKQRLVLGMLALFLPLFALLVWRLVAGV